MSHEPLCAKRAREDDGGGNSQAKRRTVASPARDEEVIAPESDERHHPELADEEELARLASRVDMLEDLLIELQGEKNDTKTATTASSMPFDPASPLVLEIEDSAQPPPLPDWASRARRTEKKRPAGEKKRAAPIVQNPQAPDDSHEMLEMTIRNLEKSTNSEQLSLPHDDDDLLIRGILYGWDAVARNHQLDTVWRFLRMFDLYLYKPMSPISKLAALRALRAMLVHRIQPWNQALRSIPYFFQPTELQQKEKHSSLIDYFAWPSVRDHLIRHSRDIRSIPRIAQTKFAQNFVFDWPYEFTDAFMTVKASGRLVFSENFNKRWNDLRYWTITAFDDTNFIPTHLQLDRKQLTSCAERIREREHDLGIGERHASGADPKADTGSPGRVLGMAAAQEDHSNDQHGTQREESPFIPPALDEWSWHFTNTRETYDTIQALFEMAIPS